MEKALEGKDVKDLLLNVGSGGGAAAPAAGGAAAAGAGGNTEEAPKEEEKEEGKIFPILVSVIVADIQCREGRVRRRYGFWSFRLIAYFYPSPSFFQSSDRYMELCRWNRSAFNCDYDLCRTYRDWYQSMALGFWSKGPHVLEETIHTIESRQNSSITKFTLCSLVSLQPPSSTSQHLPNP